MNDPFWCALMMFAAIPIAVSGAALMILLCGACREIRNTEFWRIFSPGAVLTLGLVVLSLSSGCKPDG